MPAGGDAEKDVQEAAEAEQQSIAQQAGGRTEASAAENRLLDYIQALDLNRMTPLEAINCLYEMKELAEKQ